MEILVSNAGIQIVHPIEEFPFADWKRMLAVHLDGAFEDLRAAYEGARRRGRGAFPAVFETNAPDRPVADRQSWLAHVLNGADFRERKSLDSNSRC
ncbi:D-beta-hydroxybutyrate dehydrogenase [Sinorhizobium sojae CCBAU 05684]|uniref:D-beta-hydroxybutyrate dehydrogenase n=1 Tax=Sinorhizobium sojae CCBAU 05684 TaxID=716928 RepID=A0A249PHW0_9HYPH|nr:hypothetical protein [Sinorhizobium sojae]ASY64879.1 D-beta-hydroxybutyrate dehydrogenase [Sinorhizobium sojae CCBAU 05684]